MSNIRLLTLPQCIFVFRSKFLYRAFRCNSLRMIACLKK